MVMANGGHDIEEFYHTLFHAQWGHMAIMGHPINFHFIINDIFMALFFGIACKEITEACLPGGSLNPPIKAANPLFATIGGVVGPVGVYILLGSQLEFGKPTTDDLCKPLAATDGGSHRRLESIEPGETGTVGCVFGTAWEEIWGASECHSTTMYCEQWMHDPTNIATNFTVKDYAWGTIAHGWGIPTATDISLAWMVATVIFGAGHPSISFLLLLAVADDGLGLIIIAVFYPNPNHEFQAEYLLLVLAGMILALAMRKRWVDKWVWYILGPGTLSWFGLVGAALHPALALVPIVPFLPASDKPSAEEDGDGDNDDQMAVEPVTPSSLDAKQLESIEANQQQHAQAIFDRLDVDKSRTLAHDEVERYLIELGEVDSEDPTKCKPEAIARFQMDIEQFLDKDGDKEAVKFNEFYRWWQSTGGYETGIIRSALLQVELFSGITQMATDRLAKSIAHNAEDVVYRRGEPIIVAGEEGTEMFIVHNGAAAAYLSNPDHDHEEPIQYSKMVQEYQKGSIFGEIALLHSLKKDPITGKASKTTRKATVKATADNTRVWTLSSNDLHIAGEDVTHQVFVMSQAYESVKSNEEATEQHFHHAPLHLFEHQLKLPVDLGMLFFAWANAGVKVEGTGPMTWLILCSLIFGKMIGICLMSIIAHSIGFPRPKGVDLSELLVVSIVASIGLTVALFVTGEAFQADAGLERDAKFGALLSILAGLIAIVLGKILKVGGEDDSRLANMTMSEQMEEMFFLSEIRGEAEAEAVHQATKATADAALKENKRFARQITELNSQIRTQNKKIKQLQSQRILGLKDMTLKQVLDTLNAGDAAPLDTTATAAGEVPGA